MKMFLSKLTGSFAILALTAGMAIAKPGWTDDYDKGLAQAKTEKKMSLLDFTGSDWCGWCIKLDKEVFSEKEFKDYAKQNLVLIELDYPQQKRLTKHTKDQNEKLKGEYKIKGYPTVIILDSEGKQVGQLGYMEGGPKAFIAALDKLKTK